MLVKKRGLGKGLGSLLSNNLIEDNETEKKINEYNFIKNIKITKLKSGKYQPRKKFNAEHLNELADSIREKGIIQPILIREYNGIYEIVAGERRWKAAKIAGLKEVPCIIKEIKDNDAVVFSLIENIQRENLNVMEEAIGLKRLVEEFSLSHKEVGKIIGKNRTTISNLIRLNNLDEKIKELIIENIIEMGHGRALLSCNNEMQLKLVEIQKN